MAGVAWTGVCCVMQVGAALPHAAALGVVCFCLILSLPAQLRMDTHSSRLLAHRSSSCQCCGPATIVFLPHEWGLGAHAVMHEA